MVYPLVELDQSMIPDKAIEASRECILVVVDVLLGYRHIFFVIINHLQVFNLDQVKSLVNLFRWISHLRFFSVDPLEVENTTFDFFMLNHELSMD